MMGTTHAVSGAAAWLLAYPAVAELAPLTTEQVIVGTGLAAGAAMLPDLDQGGIHLKGLMPASHGATIARTYGPVTAALAWCIGRLAGGHRRGTHSLFGLAAFTGLAWICGWGSGWWAGVTVFLLLGVAVRALDLAIPGHITTTALGHALLLAPVAWWVTVNVDLEVLLPVTVALGCATHIAGDCCTVGGCPLWWPTSPHRTSWTGLRTNSGWERRAVYPALIVVTVLLVWWRLPAGVLPHL